MNYEVERAVELIASVPWEGNEVLRLFWIRIQGEGRNGFAARLNRRIDEEEILAIPVRLDIFSNSNALLSDMQRLFESVKTEIEALSSGRPKRLTIILLAKDEFKMAQVASPIVLPHWFPIGAGKETFFRISDLGATAESALLNCPEIRVEHISQLVYDLEVAIVERLVTIATKKLERVRIFLSEVYAAPVRDANGKLTEFQMHLRGVADKRAYRLSGAEGSKSIASHLIRLVLRSSPKDLAQRAKALGAAVEPISSMRLKPTLFAVMLRPKAELTDDQANWHATLLALYQAYQVFNGAAHAGEYRTYPVSLLHHSGVDLRRFLTEATASFSV